MEHIRIERDGRLGLITIDRPDRHNSLDVQTAQDLRRAGLAMARAEDVGAVMIRGTAGVFCDLREAEPLDFIQGAKGMSVFFLSMALPALLAPMAF